jgi:hypothetical protein
MPKAPPALRIRLTRLNPTHHRFEAIRATGSVETRVLETRSFLIHDLGYFALESEAALSPSFYGQHAAGGPLEDPDMPVSGEGTDTGFVVGPLQAAVQGDVDARLSLHGCSKSDARWKGRRRLG